MGADLIQPIRFVYDGQTYIKTIAFADEKKTHNLLALFTRKKGTLFRVDKEKKLVEVKGCREWLRYKWNEKKNRAEVKAAIDAALAEFNDFLSRLQDQKVAEVAAKYLFDKRARFGIGRLGKTLYNHKLLKCDNLFSKYLLPKNTVRLKLSDRQFFDMTSEKFAGKTLPFPLQMDLGNETINHNFKKLLKRKKGQIYQVDDKGKLVKVSSCLKYRWNKQKNEKKVQQVVTDVVTQLDAYIAKTEMTEIHQLVMKQLFSTNGSFCRMSQKTFNRGAIKAGSALENCLNVALNEEKEKGVYEENLTAKRDQLVLALKELRDSKEEQLNECKKKVEKAFLDLAVAELKFAQKLGVDLRRITLGGSGGARFGYARDGRKILVVKPEDEGPLGVNNPQWYARLKRLLITPKSCLEGNSEPMAERDSWLWDRCFNIWSVPPTDVRYVASANFAGNRYKECSVQMYISDVETLGEYVGISPRISWLPRRFLRWKSGSSENTGLFSIFGKGETRKKELMTKLPKHLLERVAIHNFGIEDIDCHLDNILVKMTTPSQKKTLLDRLFAHDISVQDKEIETLVQTLFESDHNQELLSNLLHSEPVNINGETKKIALIKHDGGASNPRLHPSWWDYLSLRFKHLFEVLPHFEEGFSEKGEKLVQNKKEVFSEFLLEKAKRNLKGIMTDEVFNAFWSVPKNQRLFKEWVFEIKDTNEFLLRDRLSLELTSATNENEIPKLGSYYKWYFGYHLQRIKSSLKTRVDCFRVLETHVLKDRKMRKPFKDVKSAEDFNRELKEQKDFAPTMKERQQKFA